MNLPKNHPSRIRPVLDEEGKCVAIRYRPSRWQALLVFPYLAVVAMGILVVYWFVSQVCSVPLAGTSTYDEAWIWKSLAIAVILLPTLVVLAEMVAVEAFRQWPYLRRRTTITFCSDRMVISPEGCDSVVLPWDQLESVRSDRRCLVFKGGRRVHLPMLFWTREYPFHKESFRQLFGRLIEAPFRLPEDGVFRRTMDKGQKILEDDFQETYGRQCRVIRNDDGHVKEIVLPLSRLTYWGHALGMVLMVLFLFLVLYGMLTERFPCTMAIPFGVLGLFFLTWNGYFGMKYLAFWFPGRGALHFQRERLVVVRHGHEMVAHQWGDLLKIQARSDFCMMAFRNGGNALLPVRYKVFFRATKACENDFHNLLGDLLEEKRVFSLLERFNW
ncbi:MAG: hypothetical protein GXY15_04830 [Candidatus Hydrogenedentes bacterium]|nr:hypothetical protein [Candidatus Hydrogenedentota bacterium]